MRNMARRTKAAARRTWRSSSRASLRWWLIQATVRSTIHRLGSTTKRCGLHRRTICRSHGPVRCVAAAIFGPWYPPSPITRSMEGTLPARLLQQRLGAGAILHIRRMDPHAQQQSERVGQDVALGPEGLLAGIVTRRVQRRPPF